MKDFKLVAVYQGISKWVPKWYIEEGVIAYYECYSIYYNYRLGKYYVLYGSSSYLAIQLDLTYAKVFFNIDDAEKYIENEMHIERYINDLPF